MARSRGKRTLWGRATIARLAVLASILQAVLLLAAVAGNGACRSHDAPASFEIASADCGASAAGQQSPTSPTMPHDRQCCIIGSAVSLSDAVEAFVSLSAGAGETAVIGFSCDPGTLGPEPARPWSSRAPPSL
jgi:hypothetical protein